MNVPMLLDFNKSQLTVIRQMCAKDCNDMEFSLFIEMCRARGLNPLLKHIYAMVLNKDSRDPKKPRQLTIIVSVEGQRHIANRGGDYRPDDKVPRYEADPDLKDAATNPAGLISAEVGCYAFRHDGWHYAPHIAYWEEYAPLIEEWAEDPVTGQRGKTGRLILDPKKPMWRKMSRNQLAKCAEFGALRKAFPDDFGGLYGEEEMDRAHSQDMSASEILAQAAEEARIERVGGPGFIIDFMAGGPLTKIPQGQFADRVLAYLTQLKGHAAAIAAFEHRNNEAFRDFWAVAPGDAMELRKAIDKLKIPDAEEAPSEPVTPKEKAKAPPPLRLEDGEHAKRKVLHPLRGTAKQTKKP